DDTWQKPTVSGDKPSRRFWGEMIWDGARGRLVVFGGHDDGPIGLINDTWSLQISDDLQTGTWTRLIAGDTGLRMASAVDRGSPERRSKQSLVVYGDTAWLFGGIGDCGPLDDVWTLDLKGPKAWQ